MQINNIYIKKIYFKEKYMQFKENTEIEFNKINNVIIGNNGTGKSTLISIIYDIISNGINFKSLYSPYLTTTVKPFLFIGFGDEKICKILSSCIMHNIIYNFNNINADIYNENLKNNFENDFEKDFINIGEQIYKDIMNNGLKIDYCYYYYPIYENIINFINNYSEYIKKQKDNKNIKINDIIKNIFNIDEIEILKNEHNKLNKIIKNIVDELKNQIAYINNEHSDYDLITQVFNDIINYESYQQYNTSNIMSNNLNLNGNKINYIKNSDLFFSLSNNITEYSKHTKCFNILRDKFIFEYVNILYYEITGKKFKMIDNLKNCNNLGLPIEHINIDINKVLSIKYELNDDMRKQLYEHMTQKSIIINAHYENINEGKCSFGENELIDFLTFFIYDKSKIMLIDEPCQHLSQQNSNKLMSIITKNNAKQVIFITHDSKKISYTAIDNIIYITNSNALCTNAMFEIYKKKITNGNINSFKKKIYEYKNIFFEKKILCVEGLTDLKVMTVICELNNIDTFIVQIGGCTSDIPYICNLLGKNVKCIYDLDVIFSSLGEKALCEIIKNGKTHKNSEIILKDNEISLYKKIFSYNKKFINDDDEEKKFDKKTFNDIDDIRKYIMEKFNNVYFHNSIDLNIEGFIGSEDIDNISFETIEKELNKKNYQELINFLKS